MRFRRRDAGRFLYSNLGETGGDGGPSQKAHGRILLGARTRVGGLRNEGEHEIEDMDASGAVGDFDCGAGCAAGDVDIVRAAAGRPGDAGTGATAGRRAEAA